ncbi:MAG: hypothetical protein HY537_18775 [Deltaproteobacteria bacterium]|nr:hypothetical protein [Deltaproteobacteria bacterium]
MLSGLEQKSHAPFTLRGLRETSSSSPVPQLIKCYLLWYYLSVGTVRRGNYSFRTWVGDHSPRHVHIYRDGKLIAKWNLDAGVVMEGRVNRKLREIVGALVKEGKL